MLPVPEEREFKINPSHLEWSTTRGSGPGGQARNKTESCVIVHHVPTGQAVRCDSERSQSQNRAQALELLRARLFAESKRNEKEAVDANRRQQVGSGQRGDKVRTIRVQDGVVTDHRLGKKTRLVLYQEGDFSALLQ